MAEGLHAEGDGGDDRDRGEYRHEPEPPRSPIARKVSSVVIAAPVGH